MIYNEGLDYSPIPCEYYIEYDCIKAKRIRGKERKNLCNLNNKTPIYTQFTSLKNSNDILKFIKKYGFINLESGTITKISVNPEKHFESIKYIETEVTLMNALLEVIRELQKDISDKSSLERFITKIHECINKTDSFTGEFPDYYAAQLICEILNERLSSTSDKITYDVFHKKFVQEVYVDTLLSVMYIEIFNSLIKEVKIAKCENQKCQNWFEIGTKHAQHYCTDACRLAVNQRKYRRRSKNKANEKQNDNSKKV